MSYCRPAQLEFWFTACWERDRMVIWLNGAFGAGKTQTAYELHRRLPDSFVYDPENAGCEQICRRSVRGSTFRTIPCGAA